MNKVRMALCFLDEEDNIIAKRDLKVNWDLDQHDMKGIESIIVMDEVANILTYQLKLDLGEGAVRELLDEMIRNKK